MNNAFKVTYEVELLYICAILHSEYVVTYWKMYYRRLLGNVQ